MTAMFCLVCDHQHSYHGRDGCTMPVVPGTTVPISHTDTSSERCACNGTARPVAVRLTPAEVEMVSQLLRDEVSKCRAEVEHWSRDRRWAYAGARRRYHEQRIELLAALLTKLGAGVPS